MPHLLLRITQGDGRFRDIFPAIQGYENLKIKNYWSNGLDLADIDGGSASPLILLAHANPEMFVTQEGPPRVRLRGDELIRNLLLRGLKRNSFAFCLIAGCHAADNNMGSLFAQVGRGLGKPTIASTTSVAMNREAGRIKLQPRGDGEWKVYFPYAQGLVKDENGAFVNKPGMRSLSHDKCAQFREQLRSSAFCVKNNNGTEI